MTRAQPDDPAGSVRRLLPGPFLPAREAASMFGLWRTFNSVVFYLTLGIGLGGLVGNGLVLWHLGFHIKKGPLSVCIPHLAAADFLFLACQVGFSVVQAALGSQDTLYFAVAFAGVSVGLRLLAAFGAERCLSEVFPSGYQRCRPRHIAGVVCGLVWALGPLAVLLTGNACSPLPSGTRPLPCPRYHSASVVGLLSRACVACLAGLVLFVGVACCSQRQRPKLCGFVLGSVLLLLPCGLPFILDWSLRPLLNFPLPVSPPLATFPACVHSSSKPLICFTGAGGSAEGPGGGGPAGAGLSLSVGLT